MAQISKTKREQCCPSRHREGQTFAVISPHSPLPFPGTKQTRVEHFASLPPVDPLSTLPGHPHSQVSSPNTQRHILPGPSSGCTYEELRRLSYEAMHRCHTLLRTGRKEKQRTKHSSNKEKTRYQHQELYASFKNLKRNTRNNINYLSKLPMWIVCFPTYSPIEGKS